jgi:hypothetical protein
MRKCSIIVVFTLGFVALLVFLNLIGRASYYDQYICTACARKCAKYSQRIGVIRYHSRAINEDTPISRALKLEKCQHQWMRFRFGHSMSSHLWGSTVVVDGGCRSDLLKLLLLHEKFASDLAAMPNASEVLQSLFLRLNQSRDLDESLWLWMEEADTTQFSDWWKQNKALVNSISK